MRKWGWILCLFCLIWALPAQGEAYTDMASLSAAVAAAKKDTTFTIAADLYGEAVDCLLTNKTKAVITLDGQGHYVDSLLFNDGTFVVSNMQLDVGVLTSEKKDNTVQVTLLPDVKVRTMGYSDTAKGKLMLRNEGFIQQVISRGTAAAITLENTGLIEGPSAVQIRDERFVDYQKVKSGKVTIKNDGVIRGLTGAGMILAPFAGTTINLSGEGVIEGPVGMILCANSAPDKAQVTIDHQLRSCNTQLEAAPEENRDFWLTLKNQVTELELPIPSDEEALTAPFQRKVREAQIDLILGNTGVTHEQALGRALCITQTERIPYNLSLTLKGTLWGEQGLITLPDMNQKKGTLSIKSSIAEDSPSRRMDIVYLQHLLDISPATWPKKLSSLASSSFSGKLPEGITFHTQTVQATEEGGAVYSTGWNGPAMMELTASKNMKGKWEVQSQLLAVPQASMDHCAVLAQLAQLPANSLFRLDGNASYNRSGGDRDYRAASGPYTLEGGGYSLGKVDAEADDNSYNTRLTLLKSLTIQNFDHFNGVDLWAHSKFKGELILKQIKQLGHIYLVDLNAHLSSVGLADEAMLSFSHNDSGTRTVTLDETCSLAEGHLTMSCSSSSSKPGTLHVVNNAASVGESLSWAGISAINASNGSTVKLTGSGSFGNWEESRADYGHLTVRTYSGGKVILDQRIASLEIDAGSENPKYSKGSVQVGGQVRHLTVDCDVNADDVSITVTAAEMETFTVKLTCDNRTEPMTDKEASAYLKKNAPTIKASKAMNAAGEKMLPLYQIRNEQSALLWEGHLPSGK